LLDNVQLASCESGFCAAVTKRSSSLASQAAAIANILDPYDVSGFFHDGSFTRLREIGVTLTAPARWSSFLHCRSASLTLSGRNLALWTKFPGDPEQNQLPGPSAAPFSPGGVPMSKLWIARVNLGL
jgi:hypothetical protein